MEPRKRQRSPTRKRQRSLTSNRQGTPSAHWGLLASPPPESHFRFLSPQGKSHCPPFRLCPTLAPNDVVRVTVPKSKSRNAQVNQSPSQQIPVVAPPVKPSASNGSASNNARTNPTPTHINAPLPQYEASTLAKAPAASIMNYSPSSSFAPTVTIMGYAPRNHSSSNSTDIHYNPPPEDAIPPLSSFRNPSNWSLNSARTDKRRPNNL